MFRTDRVPDERAVPHHTAVDRQREDGARRQPIIPWFLLELRARVAQVCAQAARYRALTGVEQIFDERGRASVKRPDTKRAFLAVYS